MDWQIAFNAKGVSMSRLRNVSQWVLSIALIGGLTSPGTAQLRPKTANPTNPSPTNPNLINPGASTTAPGTTNPDFPRSQRAGVVTTGPRFRPRLDYKK